MHKTLCRREFSRRLNPSHPFKRPRQKLPILVIAFIALGVLGYLAKKAIEKSGPKITEQLIEKGLEKGIGENVDLNLDKGNFEIKGDEGSFSASDKLPDDFPKDVPLYTGAKITSSITAKGTDDKSSSVTVSLTTKDSVDKVSAFYAAELKDNSWVVDSDYTTEEGYALSASKDGRSLFVTASGNIGETSITVSVVTE